MLRNLILAAGVALALLAPAYAADPQTFKTEDSATAFRKPGERGLVQPGVENLLPAWLAVLRQDEGRRLHLPGVGRQGGVQGQQGELSRGRRDRDAAEA